MPTHRVRSRVLSAESEDTAVPRHTHRHTFTTYGLPDKAQPNPITSHMRNHMTDEIAAGGHN